MEIKKEDDTINQLKKMLQEDFNKECNKNLTISMGGVAFNKESIITGKPPEDYLFDQFTKLTNYLFMAENFIMLQPVYYDEAGIFWVWNLHKFKWEIVDETDLLNLIDKHTKNPTTAPSVKYELLEALKRVGRKYKPAEHKPSWVQFGAKIIDIATNEELTAKPQFFITNPLEWELGYSEDTPVIDNLFESWVGKEHIPELYEIISFCMLPSYFIDRLFCLIGNGANGKSTYLKILINFIGLCNVTTSNLALLLTQRFEGSKLLNKLVCLMGETNFNTLNNTDYLKKLTGKDLIRAEFKGKNCFDFMNYAKLILATNSLPPTADKTDGFYRRWKIIEFPNQFKKETDILSTIPLIEYNNLALKCLNIAKRLWKERAFTNDGSFEDRKKNYEEKSNPLNAFLKENYIKDTTNSILFSEFYDEFITYLNDRGFRILTNIAVSKQLRAEGFDIKAQTKDKVNAKYILGLKIKDECPECPECSIVRLDTIHEETDSNQGHLEHLGHSIPIEAYKKPTLPTTIPIKQDILPTTTNNLGREYINNEDFKEIYKALKDAFGGLDE